MARRLGFELRQCGRAGGAAEARTPCSATLSEGAVILPAGKMLREGVLLRRQNHITMVGLEQLGQHGTRAARCQRAIGSTRPTERASSTEVVPRGVLRAGGATRWKNVRWWAREQHRMTSGPEGGRAGYVGGRWLRPNRGSRLRQGAVLMGEPATTIGEVATTHAHRRRGWCSAKCCNRKRLAPGLHPNLRLIITKRGPMLADAGWECQGSSGC
jgi:hypothetical protein